MKKILILFLGLAISGMGCVTPTQNVARNMDMGAIPVFDGPIYPIIKPVYVTKKPIKSQFQILYTIDDSNEQPLEGQYEGDYVVTRLENLYYKKFAVKNLVYRDTRMDSESPPLFDLNILVDDQDTIKKTDITLPYFNQEKENGHPVEIDDKIVKEVETIKEFVSAFPAEISTKPIISGGEISTKIIDRFVYRFLNRKPNCRDITLDDLKLKTLGWSNYDNKKVIVSSINETMGCNVKTLNYIVLINGYVLIDMDNYEAYVAKILLEIIGIQDDKKAQAISTENYQKHSKIMFVVSTI